MSPLNDASLFLVNTLFGLYVYTLIARFLLQASRADFYNPLAQFIWRVTNPVVQPLQRWVPRWRSWDLATLAFAWAVLVVNLSLDFALLSVPWSPSVVVLALLKLLLMFLSFYTFSILIQAVMSWFGAAGHSPAYGLLFALNEPLLRPVRRRLPPIGGLDLSPLLVIIALQVVSILVPLAPVLR